MRNHSREYYRRKERRLEKARQERLQLIEDMGGCCQECQTTEDLELHHTQLRTWTAAKTSSKDRPRKYRQDFEAGVLILLCKTCNRAAGIPEDPDDQPF